MEAGGSRPQGGRSIDQLAAELALALREVALPDLGNPAARGHSGEAVGGDVTFRIDARAEEFLADYMAEHAPGLAYYSEDHGLVVPERLQGRDPEWVLVVDPIDGTRPAIAGLESACVSVAAAFWRDGRPTMGDVVAGCIVEIKSGQAFLAIRGGGIDPAPRLSPNTDIERMLWVYGLRGRPAIPMAVVLGEMIDRSSVGGASFDLGSACFDVTRVITGQLDAYIEPGPRMVEEVEGMREEFVRAGRGSILNNSPYDLAAAALCLTEAGGVVTDATGRSLDHRPLLGSGPEHQMSCVAVSNLELHGKILEELDSGLVRLHSGWGSGG